MSYEKIYCPGSLICTKCHRVAKYYWVYDRSGDSWETYTTSYDPRTSVCKKHMKKLMKEIRKGESNA